MKIFCLYGNYAGHNKTEQNALKKDGAPVVFCKPDTALTKSGKPFFAPDDLGRIDYGVELAVRINRLGKSIPVRFAHRYWDAVTVGIGFRAVELQGRLRKKGLPWEMSTCFDGSAVIGEWIPKDKLPEANRLSFHLDVNGTTVQTGLAAEMTTSIDEAISYISRWMTVRTGDILFTGCPESRRDVNIEDLMEGFIGEKKVMECKCK